MKIFSLQSKTSLVVWSVILGIISQLLIYALTFKSFFTDCGELCIRTSYGWPLVYNNSLGINVGIGFLLVNLLFWTLVSLITLSLIRYFRNKKA